MKAICIQHSPFILAWLIVIQAKDDMISISTIHFTIHSTIAFVKFYNLAALFEAVGSSSSVPISNWTIPYVDGTIRLPGKTCRLVCLSFLLSSSFVWFSTWTVFLDTFYWFWGYFWFVERFSCMLLLHVKTDIKTVDFYVSRAAISKNKDKDSRVVDRLIFLVSMQLISFITLL